MNDTHKQKLEEEKKTLTAELGKLGTHDPATNTWEAKPEAADENEADPNSQADRFEDFEENSATMHTLAERLDQVDAALAAIESGTYGTCGVCGNKIEDERLHANPAAMTCIAHME